MDKGIRAFARNYFAAENAKRIAGEVYTGPKANTAFRKAVMVDFSKHKHGDVVVVHCCDECARKAGVNPKRPADSGKASWLCDVCGHHGIGSLTGCEIGDWLRLRPLQPNARSAAQHLRR